MTYDPKKKSILKKIRNYYLKRIKWRKYDLGPQFHAGRGCHLWARNIIKTGLNFYMGRYSQIECDAVIGDYVFFANYVALVGRYDHDYREKGVPILHAENIKSPTYKWLGMNSKVVIEDDVWVGYGAIILSGVLVGQGSIIAAGSVVTKNVEPFSIYAGNPAKKIKDRFESQTVLEEHLHNYKKFVLKNE